MRQMTLLSLYSRALMRSSDDWVGSEPSGPVVVKNAYVKLATMTVRERTIVRLAAWLLILLPAAPSWGQPVEVLGTRALGMAGAFVAVADDPSGVYWNPSG